MSRSREILVWFGLIFLLGAFGLGTLVLSYFFAVWIEQVSGSRILGQSMGLLLFVSLAGLMGIAFGVIKFLIRALKHSDKKRPPES